MCPTLLATLLHPTGIYPPEHAPLLELSQLYRDVNSILTQLIHLRQQYWISKLAVVSRGHNEGN